MWVFLKQTKKNVSLFKTSTTQYYKPKCGGGKEPRKPKIKKKQLEDNIFKGIRNIVKLKKENEVSKDLIIRDFRSLFESEKYYCKLARVGSFHSNK